MGKRGPKAKGLTPDVERQIVELAGQGLSAAEIATRTGANARTVSRRLEALRGSQRPRPGSPVFAPPPPPASASEGNVAAEDDDDEDEALERGLTDEELAAAAAGGTDPLDELIRKLAADWRTQVPGPLRQRIVGDYLKALDLRRKMTPPEVPDPNEHPDMIKLGATVAERLHKMLDLVCEESRQG